MGRALTYILLAIPTAAQAPRTVDAIRVISGAILVEDFEQPELESNIWHSPEWLARHNPYIAVAPDHGQLHLRGIAGRHGSSICRHHIQ